MHVAICDDNGADRKQMERLLKRESDKRAATTGVLYVDSYGNVEALLANALTYDVFYVDVCLTPGVTVADVVDGIRKKGSTAPIVLCSSKINYREQSFPENVYFLDKAIKPSELSESIDKALAIKDSTPPVLELRDETGTVYVTEDEIIYAVTKGRTILVTLTNGRTKQVRTDLINLFSQWAASHDCFVPPTTRYILNCKHIKKLGLVSVRMSDGKSFFISHSTRSYTQLLMEHLAAQQESDET